MNKLIHSQLKKDFDSLYPTFANKDFIPQDPISIPYLFSKQQDIEIAGFFAAIFAWGRRDIIISKARELMELMDYQPYEFVHSYQPKDYKQLLHFKHRTFNASDLDFYLRAFQVHYQSNLSLETAFYPSDSSIQISDTIENGLVHFYDYISGIVPCEKRNLKHISTPIKNAACKRLCMYLRWMIRKDDVDFGLWRSIDASQLVIPLDVHVMRVATAYGILTKDDKPNWKTALKLTNYLKTINAKDPVKYDFVLFNLGVKSLTTKI